MVLAFAGLSESRRVGAPWLDAETVFPASECQMYFWECYSLSAADPLKHYLNCKSSSAEMSGDLYLNLYTVVSEP